MIVETCSRSISLGVYSRNVYRRDEIEIPVDLSCRLFLGPAFDFFYYISKLFGFYTFGSSFFLCCAVSMIFVFHSRHIHVIYGATPAHLSVRFLNPFTRIRFYCDIFCGTLYVAFVISRCSHLA